MFRNPLDPGYAAAARRRARRGPEPPRTRAAARAALVLVLLATGFLLALAYRQTVAAQPESQRARAGLVSDVKTRQSEADALSRQADALHDEVTRARDQALDGSQLDRLRELEAATGLTRVTGDAIEVSLGDAPQPVDPVTGKPTDSNPGRVRDRDLQDIGNELWRDGAEAIAINGQRLTATSTIRTAGSTILVDFQPVTSPYSVRAIGPPDLDKRFTNSATGRRFREYSAVYGMKVSVRRLGQVTLPAAADQQLHYAQPVPSARPSGSPSGGVPVSTTASPARSSSGGR